VLSMARAPFEKIFENGKSMCLLRISEILGAARAHCHL
jgi:hypothetical protein